MTQARRLGSFRTIRFDIVEVAAILLFAVMLFAVRRDGQPPGGGPPLVEPQLMDGLQRRFGPERYSRGPEEWLIRDFFDDRRNGIFVDVGASRPVTFSNSYRLERDLGWSGIAIDALKEFAKPYAELRPRSHSSPRF